MFGTELSCLKSTSALYQSYLFGLFSSPCNTADCTWGPCTWTNVFSLSSLSSWPPHSVSLFFFLLSLSLFHLSGGLSDIPRLPLSSLCSQGWRLALNLSSSCFSLWLLLPVPAGLAWISKSSFIYLEWSQNYFWSLLGWEGNLLTIFNTKP